LLGAVGGAEWGSVVAAAVELAKAGLPVLALALFATRTVKGTLVGAVFGIAWLIAGVLSAKVADATINDLFSGRERLGQKTAETRAGLQVDLAETLDGDNGARRSATRPLMQSWANNAPCSPGPRPGLQERPTVASPALRPISVTCALVLRSATLSANWAQRAATKRLGRA
jgi:hypothetical protein